MIEAQHLSKRFGNNIAVNDVSFTVDKGRPVGLLGPNGAGKTTIMRMLTGYIPPTEGRVLVAGQEMYGQPEAIKKMIGYLPEQPPVYMDMTVREYLNFSGHIRALNGVALDSGVSAAAEMCGISDKLNRLIGNLSKGYRQRVGLAQALVHDPDILILDEPTVGLDPKQIIEIRQLIRELGEQKTVILSTHILQEVTNICSTVAIINEGRLLVSEAIDNLTAQSHGHTHVSVTVIDKKKLDLEALRLLPDLHSLEWVEDDTLTLEVSDGEDVRANIAEIAVSSGAGLLELKTDAMVLEDVYLRVISGAESPIQEE